MALTKKNRCAGSFMPAKGYYVFGHTIRGLCCVCGGRVRMVSRDDKVAAHFPREP
ncbi:hypothetical protein SAMN05421810_10197 [Amycolatopsis arida]|uniref:Uncharacterized protein n=1 Tax=Amycolatopsis arida TaxID=587909 RepID=A0A1I5KDW3_9PSEU|nr:hypothetical protein CLV69_10295 [Amycolatopsis arida]SFO82933.1 hypothetical protein SAMN05421810_10197 [Amycolatopsis arida]